MLSIDKAMERAFYRCNLIGENCDVWEVLYQYKAFCELSEEEQYKIYDQIVLGLGFTR